MDVDEAREWIKQTCVPPAPAKRTIPKRPAVPKSYPVDPPIAELVPEKWDKNTISTWLLQMMHSKHFGPQHRIKCCEDYCKIQGIFDLDAVPDEEDRDSKTPAVTVISPPLTDDDEEEADEDREEE